MCTSTREIVWSVSGDQGQTWQEANLTIFAADRLHNYRMRIEGIIGSGYLSDIAIDDVTISAGICGG